ncbi:tail fiber assembly protein [Cronobacter muytjensii]
MLLSQAHSVTSDWRVELMLGTISNEDRASLLQWMKYIREIKSLDFTGVNDKGSYNTLTWPPKPD